MKRKNKLWMYLPSWVCPIICTSITGDALATLAAPVTANLKHEIAHNRRTRRNILSEGCEVECVSSLRQSMSAGCWKNACCDLGSWGTRRMMWELFCGNYLGRPSYVLMALATCWNIGPLKVTYDVRWYHMPSGESVGHRCSSPIFCIIS